LLSQYLPNTQKSQHNEGEVQLPLKSTAVFATRYGWYRSTWST